MDGMLIYNILTTQYYAYYKIYPEN